MSALVTMAAAATDLVVAATKKRGGWQGTPDLVRGDGAGEGRTKKKRETLLGVGVGREETTVAGGEHVSRSCGWEEAATTMGTRRWRSGQEREWRMGARLGVEGGGALGDEGGCSHGRDREGGGHTTGGMCAHGLR